MTLSFSSAQRTSTSATPRPRADSATTVAPEATLRVPLAVPASMRAVTQRRYGGTDTLELATVSVPAPADNEVLIRVEASGVDRAVWHLMTGLPLMVRAMGFGLARPAQPVPGLDLAGRVVATGAAVTEFAIGDDVVGIGSGSWAEYARADVSKLAHRPPGVPAGLAAAVPESGITALQAVRDVAAVAPGQHVLILGASGGVGSFAVQIAKHLGARVTAVASAVRRDFVLSLGAERAIDYRAEDPLVGDTRYDAIIDIAGRRPVAALRRALAPHGTLVIVGGEGGDRLTGGIGRQLGACLLSPFVSQKLAMMVAGEKGSDVATLLGWLNEGSLRVPVAREYPLDAAAMALDDLAAGRVAGKAVIRVRR